MWICCEKDADCNIILTGDLSTSEHITMYMLGQINCRRSTGAVLYDYGVNAVSLTLLKDIPMP